MLRLFALLVLAVALAAPAQAQSRREMSARLDAAEARLAEIEARALQGDPVAETLTIRIDALEREQRALTGEVERLAFDNRRLRDQIAEMQRTLDLILAGGAVASDPAAGGPALLEPSEVDPGDPFGEARAQTVRPLQAPDGLAPQNPDQSSTEGSSSGPASLVAPASVEDPDTVFQRGRARLLEGDFVGAREAFESFTLDHAGDPRAAEAFYWLGETHFVNGDLSAAADAYIASLQSNRRGEKAPDALVRLGASLAGLGETQRACQVLATFSTEFPNADEEARRKAQRETARIGCR